MSAGRGIPQEAARSTWQRQAAALAAVIGREIRAERERRGLTLADLAAASGLSVSAAQGVESGRPARLATYVRLARALRLRLTMDLLDPRRREAVTTARAQDPVHAAMGEMEAARFRRLGYRVGLDEPFQHFQFAGRADLVAWSVERAALLHVENRTQLPDIQESFGSFNAKRAYLGRELAGRAGLDGWRSETHVMAALWSAEVLRAIRAHRQSFESVCPDSPEAFAAWWRGEPPAAGRHSLLVILDPIEGRRRDSLAWIGLAELSDLRPRYRDYAGAARLLSVGCG